MCNITFNVFSSSSSSSKWGFYSFIFLVIFFIYFIMCEYHRTFKTYTHFIMSLVKGLSSSVSPYQLSFLFLFRLVMFFNVEKRKEIFCQNDTFTNVFEARNWVLSFSSSAFLQSFCNFEVDLSSGRTENA